MLNFSNRAKHKLQSWNLNTKRGIGRFQFFTTPMYSMGLALKSRGDGYAKEKEEQNDQSGILNKKAWEHTDTGKVICT